MQTLQRWRAKYGGMTVNEAQDKRRLEDDHQSQVGLSTLQAGRPQRATTSSTQAPHGAPESAARTDAARRPPPPPVRAQRSIGDYLGIRTSTWLLPNHVASRRRRRLHVVGGRVTTKRLARTGTRAGRCRGGRSRRPHVECMAMNGFRRPRLAGAKAAVILNSRSYVAVRLRERKRGLSGYSSSGNW